MPRRNSAPNLTRYGIVPLKLTAEQASMDAMDFIGDSAPAKPKLPRKKAAKPEDVLHVAVRKFLELAIAPPGCLSRDRVIWFSIESRNSGRTQVNAKTGKTFNREGQARKARGCVAGVPDVHFEWPGGSGWIELKADKGVTSTNQDNILSRLSAAGAVVAVAKSIDEVERALVAWGVPYRASVRA